MIEPKRQLIPIYLAAINQKMVELTWEIGDGVIFYLRPLEEMKKTISKMQLKNKIDVLFDDTEDHLSAKFKKFDLIGIPYQIILGSKITGDKFEFKEINGETETLFLDEIKKKLLNKRN